MVRSLRTSHASVWLLALCLLLTAGCDRGPGVEVADFSPDGEVTRTTNFTITFSKDVVSDSLLSAAVEGNPIVFSPQIPGQFQWIAPNKLRFYPEAMLAPSTQYVAEVKGGAVSPHGLSLKGTRAFEFATPRIKVESAYLTFAYDPATNRQANLTATIAFNYDVDPAEVREHVSIRYEDGERIPYQVVTQAPSTVIELAAEDVRRVEDERKIELRVEEKLKGVGGSLGLGDVFTQPALLPGQNSLKVEGMTAVRGTGDGSYVKLRFNLPVRAEGAGTFISISPAVNVQATGSHDQLRLRGDFASDQTYQITLREGLLALDGSRLGRDVTQAITFRQENIPPQVDFVGNGYYLSRDGHLNLGLSTINLDKVTVEVDKIYANNLVPVLNAYSFSEPSGYYYWNAELETIGQQVYSEDLVVPVEMNEEVVTPIPVEQYLGGERTGIFKVTARQTEQRWQAASRWVVATDLGLMAKQAGDDLWIWVNSLTTLDALDGVEVRLFSKNNQPLATARTAEDGVAVFKDYASFTDEFVPFVVTASRGEDLSFIELTRRRIETSDFDVSGMPYLLNGYEAFIYNERGVYRPGEAAHLAAVVRGPNGAVPQPFPVRMRVTGPDGKILSEQRTRLNAQGGTALGVEVPDFVLTGSYTAALLVGDNQEIGRTTFSVEEFVPDRMKVELDLDADTYRPGEAMRIEVEGMTLFGPPAAGRRLQTKVEVEPFPFAPADYRSFTFGNEAREFTALTTDLEEQMLDDEGHAQLSYTLPRDLKPPAALRAVVEATVLEPGGRGVTAYEGAVVHPYETYVGLRQRQDGYAEPGKAFPIDYVAVNPDGQPVAGRPLQVSLVHIIWNSIWRQGNDGRYHYTSEKMEQVEYQTTVTSAAEIGRLTVTPENYGSYRLVVEDPASDASTAIEFYSSGWGYAAWAMDTPDRIQLELDKERYAPGETAKVLVRAPFGGKLLLSVEREQVFDHFVVMMDGNTATVEVPVSGRYKPNVYVSAHLIRSTNGLERDESARAFGVAPLHVDTEANRLNLALDAPESIRPQSTLTVEYQVTGGEKPFVTIAAVDEGILQLTDFRSPDPHGFFYGKKRLEVETYDLYGVILPEIASSLSSPAGDIEAARRRRVSPVAARRVKPVAFWSGLLEPDGRGRGRVTFDVPQFNGTVRLMAVAYAGDRYGHAEEDVLIRDPIVLTPTFPRFAASGDQFNVPVNVFNGTGRDADFEVRLQADGPIKLQGDAVQRVRVANGREEQVMFTVAADRTLGKATFRLRASGGGQQTEDEVELPVRPPVPYTTAGGSGSLEAGRPASFTFPGAYLPGTGEYELIVSSFPAVQFSGSLQYLLQYPHGCVEQTTSRVFPLLAFNDLAKLVAPDLFNTHSADYYIEEGITRLEQMQMPSGAFAYWPGGNYSNDWSTIYVSHFLVEARRGGYVVTERVYDRMLDALSAIARSYQRSDNPSLARSAYAGYVLALAGKAPKSTLLYLKNNALDDLPPYARYQLAGAFAQSGDLMTARGLLPQAAAPPEPVGSRQTGENFNSDIRARAIMLDVLAEVDPGSPQVPRLVEELTQATTIGRWYTTQENAFAFLALGKILRQQEDASYSGSLTIGGQQVATFDLTNHRFSTKEWGGQQVSLSVEGAGRAYYYWRAVGLPSGLDVDEYDRDLVVRRRFLTERGQPVTDLRHIEQGELLVVELSLQTRGEAIQNVAVVDLLPAGLEIENPRLQSRAGIDWIGDNAYQPDHVDIRDDRLVLYGDVRSGDPHTFYYGVRAVTAGIFKLPPVQAEAMYAPMKASVANSGQIVVQAPGASASGTE